MSIRRSMTERGRRAARSVAQPFGLCRRDTLRPARRMRLDGMRLDGMRLDSMLLDSMTRPPVWRCATLEPQRVAATQRGVWRDSKQALRMSSDRIIAVPSRHSHTAVLDMSDAPSRFLLPSGEGGPKDRMRVGHPWACAASSTLAPNRPSPQPLSRWERGFVCDDI